MDVPSLAILLPFIDALLAELETREGLGCPCCVTPGCPRGKEDRCEIKGGGGASTLGIPTHCFVTGGQNQGFVGAQAQQCWLIS